MSAKIITIIMSFFFSLQSSWAFLDSKDDRELVSGSDQVPDYIKYKFIKSPVGKMVNSQDEKNFKIFPNSYRNAILGEDVPIEKIQNFHKKSNIYWTKILNSIDSNGNSSIIPQTSSLREGIVLSQIADLNLTAFKVWESMVACNDGNIQNARIGFARSREGLICEKSEYQSEIVMKNLKELALNWETFILSIEATQSGILGDLAYADTYQKVFHNLHPLLTEFTLLIWSIYFNTFSEKETPIVYQTKNDFDVCKGNYSFQTRNYNLKKNTLISLFQGSMLITYFMNIDEEQYACAVYGLWPALNSVLLDVSDILFISHVASEDQELFSKKGKSRCGPIQVNWDIELLHNQYTNIYGLYEIKGYHHKIQMQLLYDFYFSEQWDNRNSIQKAADSTIPVIQDVGGALFSLPGLNILKNIYNVLNPRQY